MGKGILGWRRQRPDAVRCGWLWIVLLLLIASYFLATYFIVSRQVPDKYLWTLLLPVIAPSLFPITFTVLMQIMSSRRSCPILAIRLILIAACLCSFLCILFFTDINGFTLHRGQGVLDSEIVSFSEAYFICVLFALGSSFQCVMIEFEDKISTVNKVIAGVLAIMGILVPELLKSWSLLTVSYDENSCYEGCDLRAGILLLQTGVAYAAGLSVMLIIGLFAESIVQSIRSKMSAMSKGSSPDDSQNTEVPVPTSEITAASDKQNDGVELAPGSSSTATCVPQEAADGGAIPAQAAETLASASGSGVDLPKSWMSAAVSGLVAGACFSVVSRLFSRR